MNNQIPTMQMQIKPNNIAHSSGILLLHSTKLTVILSRLWYKKWNEKKKKKKRQAIESSIKSQKLDYRFMAG